MGEEKHLLAILLKLFSSHPSRGKVSKRKGHLSQHPIGEVASLSTLLLARADTPNTHVKVIF